MIKANQKLAILTEIKKELTAAIESKMWTNYNKLSCDESYWLSLTETLMLRSVPKKLLKSILHLNVWAAAYTLYIANL